MWIGGGLIRGLLVRLAGSEVVDDHRDGTKSDDRSCDDGRRIWRLHRSHDHYHGRGTDQDRGQRFSDIGRLIIHYLPTVSRGIGSAQL